MNIFKDNFFLLLVILGLFVRLIFIPLPGFNVDVNDWFAWANRLNEVGFSKFYSNQIFSDYAPGYIYVLGLLGFIKNLLSLDDKTFYVILKIPAIISDIILSLLIYKELSKLTSTLYSKLGTALILFNPALIFNSTIWGQIDSVPIVFLFLAIIYLKNKSLIISSALLGVAFLIKPQVIAIVPVYLLFMIGSFSPKNLIKFILPFLLIIFFLSLPFFIDNPITGLWALIQRSAGQYSYTSIFAYNFWGMLGFWITDNYLLRNISYQVWGYILFFTYWFLIGYSFIKKRFSIYALITLATLSFYFLLTRMHERYLYPAIVFSIILAAIYKSRSILILATFISLIHFLNLYYVYVYYNEFYFKLPKLFYYPVLYNFLDINGKTMSFLSTLVFVLITISAIKFSYAHKKN